MEAYRLPDNWLGKPYYSLNAWFRQTYGEKCYKIALDAGFFCPNRDGTAGYGGCIFCSAGGSGEFAAPAGEDGDVRLRIQAALSDGKKRLAGKKTGGRFVAYFQAYTNTYGPLPRLEAAYTAALDEPDVIGISIATRPDCLGGDVLALLSDIKKAYPDKFVWVELGLQTIHDRTAAFCNRGYDLPVFEKAFRSLCARRIPVIVHVILGLPGETPEDMYETCRYLGRIPGADAHPFGVKLQLLHILKNTRLGELYEAGALSDPKSRFYLEPLSKETYTELVIHCLELLPPPTWSSTG